MNCREFKSNHVGFVDDILSAADMAEMRRHLLACEKCAVLDIRIRRSLLVVRNLPQIQPSADFYERLSKALEQAPPVAQNRRPIPAAAAFAVVTAALAAAVYFAMAIMSGHDVMPDETPAQQTMASASVAPLPVNDLTMTATVPAGVPVWPAMFMVGEIPSQVATTELLETSLGR